MHMNRRESPGYICLIVESVIFTVVVYLYYPFIQIFAKRMGADDIYFALLNASPPLVAVFVLIPCSILIERINCKKITIMLLLFINSLFYAVIAFVPALPHHIRVVSYVVLIGLMNWPGSLYNSTVQSFLADHFEGSRLNKIVSMRSKYGTLFGLITLLITGLLLTEIPRTDGERLFLYQVFYAVCFVLTLLQVYIFSRIHLPESNHGNTHRNAKPAFSNLNCSVLKDIITYKPYIYFCVCGFAFYLAWQMGWPLLNIYFINYAGLNEFQISLLNVIIGITQFLTYSMWNRLIDVKGCKLIIIFGAAGLAANPFFFMTKPNFAAILVSYVILGVFQGCYTLCIYCGLLEVLPPGGNTVYISAFNLLTNISGFIAPLIGVWIYKQTSIYFAFGVVGAFRLTAALFYIVRWKFDKMGSVYIT